MANLQHSTRRPRILLLVDRPGWAFDVAAQAVSRYLGNEFEFKLSYVIEHPDLHAWPFDLLYVFFWGETYHTSFVSDPRRVLKEVASHRWALEEEYGCVAPATMVDKYLTDAGTVVAISKRLQQVLSPHREVLFAPNGFEPGLFWDRGQRRGALKIGWAGNAGDPCKGLSDILGPATHRDFELHIAGGDLNHEQMAAFYNAIDVLCVASTAEGEPLTLLEAMACGCFPICVDVGIVPELVVHQKNGLIINRSIAGFRAALQWSTLNVRFVREAGRKNAEAILSARSWERVAPSWRQVFQHALRQTTAQSPNLTPQLNGHEETKNQTCEQNLGEDLLECPERAKIAARLLAQQPLRPGDLLIDLGCRCQTIRSMIPATMGYIPVDRCARTPDTRVMDFNYLPLERKYRAAVILGLLEYLDDPLRCLSWAIEHTDFFVFSYNDCKDSTKCKQQHWKMKVNLHQIESLIHESDARIINKVELERNECIYLVKNNRDICDNYRIQDISTDLNRKARLALFSAAIDGDNSGDSLIEDAIRRLLPHHDMMSIPLLKTPTAEQLEQINACDMVVICGTNLYQHIFSCALTPQIIERIRIPIFPLGVGSSAPISHLPKMNEEGVRAVRMIHERCVVASVRDPASLVFLRGLGIRNVELTGCPVLYHSLREPQFIRNEEGSLCLSLRARLLHVDEGWGTKAFHTLERLSKELRPILVLQSPYDLAFGEELASRFKLQCVWDENWGHTALVNVVQAARRTVGFRLHFGMLALSYGKPSTFIASDSRVSEFCGMMGLPYHDLHSYRDETLLHELISAPLPMERFVENWRSLRQTMRDVLAANGLTHSL